MSWDFGEARANVSLPDVASRFGIKLEKSGREYICLCPFHAEDTPSCTIYVGRDGVQRFHCFGCGEQGDVIDFVEKIKGVSKGEAMKILGGARAPANVRPARIEARDPYAGIVPVETNEEIEAGQIIRLYNPKRAGTDIEWGQFRPSMVFPYRRQDGSLVGYVLRRDFRDGGKETPMVMRVRLPDGTETWARFPFPKLRPLYRLDRLRDGQVIVVEGEKCADALARGWGRRSVVSWAGGTNGVQHTDWSPLAGRSVVIWPDADEPGVRAADEIASILTGLDCSVKVLDLARAA